MQKLVYINLALASAQSWLKTNDDNTLDWNNSSNVYYRSLVFTNDGHLLTHGLDFSAAASWGVGLIYNSSNGVTSSAIPGDQNTGYGVGYFPIYTKTSDNGSDRIGVTWKAVSEILSNLSTGSTSITTVGTITTGTWNGSIITVPYGGTGVSSLDSGKVLIGNGTSAVTFKAIDDTWNSESASSSHNLITTAAVYAAVNAAFAANDAMVFKGTIGSSSLDPAPTVTSLPTANYSAGYTYRVVSADTYAGKVCEIGDLIIAIKDGPSSGSTVIDADWTVAQTNIDGALTVANLTTASTGLKRHVFKDSNYLYVNLIFRKILVGGVDALGDTSTSALNFISGNGISVTYNSGVSIAINNTVTAQSTSDLYKITHNALGLITGSTTWDPSTITFDSVYAARTGDTTATFGAYDPDGNAITIKALDGLRFYKSGTDLVIGHSSVGASSTTHNNNNTTRTYIQTITVDTYGHVTAVSTATEDVINTWRPVKAYQRTSGNGEEIATIRSGTVGTNALSFGSDFLAVDKDTSNSDGNLPGSEIYLAWAEVDASGNVTYHV